jgi:peroxiredoxin Q/BCP
VSYDTPEKNRQFADENDLPFRLLSDTDRSLAKKVGAARALLPIPKRVSFLVGSDGTVLKTYQAVDPKTHAAEVMRDFRSLVDSGG